MSKRKSKPEPSNSSNSTIATPPFIDFLNRPAISDKYLLKTGGTRCEPREISFKTFGSGEEK